MALKIWTDFKSGDRVMACGNERDIGTVFELAPDATVAGRAFVRWDDGAEPSWLRADLLSPSPHVEDETWEYMLDLLLSGEVTVEDFRRQMTNAGYHVQQINNAIDYNWQDIRDMMARETPCEHCNGSGWVVLRNTFPMSYVGPGPAPDDARGVTDSRCYECRAS